jgi:hypothetical protein
MIEADIGHPRGTADEGFGAGHQVVSSEYMLQRRKSFISFDVFREKYWGHFPQPFTKGLGPLRVSIVEDLLMFQFLDVSLVFSEFMGDYHTAPIAAGSLLTFLSQVLSKVPKRLSLRRIISSTMTPTRISAREHKPRSQASARRSMPCSKRT